VNRAVSQTIESTSDGTVSGTPRLWLRLESVVLLTGALIAYSATGQHWWLVPVVVLLPDLAMTGYMAGTRVGAFLYNLAHATPAASGAGACLACPHRARSADGLRTQV